MLIKKGKVLNPFKSPVKLPKPTGYKCPNCGHEHSKVTCGWHDNVTKFRRRKCYECKTNFKTKQSIDPVGEEILVPLLSYEERTKLRRASPRHTKLTVQDVAEIKYLLKNSSFSMADLAYQYGVERGCLSSIKRGQSWKDVPTPSEYP